MFEQYEDGVNASIDLQRVFDDFCFNDVYAVIQNRVPDLPANMQLVAVFPDSDDAVDYANKIFDAYQLKGRADAFRVDVVKFSYKPSDDYDVDGWFTADELFYNVVKFGD